LCDECPNSFATGGGASGASLRRDCQSCQTLGTKAPESGEAILKLPRISPNALNPVVHGECLGWLSRQKLAPAPQLHRFTADAIAAALLEAQQKGIAAIPHVDALICQEKYRNRVCEIIGRQIFKATGVCCTVGGIRYSPLTEDEKQALAFDEIAPSGDGMSYDEWEAVRIVKCVTALKLMRRCPRLLVPVALAAPSTIQHQRQSCTVQVRTHNV